MNTQQAVSIKIQAPAPSQPSNKSISLIEWAAHQQAQRRKVDSKASDKAFLVARGYDVMPSEIFA